VTASTVGGAALGVCVCERERESVCVCVRESVCGGVGVEVCMFVCLCVGRMCGWGDAVGVVVCGGVLVCVGVGVYVGMLVKQRERQGPALVLVLVRLRGTT
jgi:hypothetical protein